MFKFCGLLVSKFQRAAFGPPDGRSKLKIVIGSGPFPLRVRVRVRVRARQDAASALLLRLSDALILFAFPRLLILLLWFSRPLSSRISRLRGDGGRTPPTIK